MAVCSFRYEHGMPTTKSAPSKFFRSIQVATCTFTPCRSPARWRIGFFWAILLKIYRRPFVDLPQGSANLRTNPSPFST
jgi:hypothetical protein